MHPNWTQEGAAADAGSHEALQARDKRVASCDERSTDDQVVTPSDEKRVAGPSRPDTPKEAILRGLREVDHAVFKLRRVANLMCEVKSETRQQTLDRLFPPVEGHYWVTAIVSRGGSLTVTQVTGEKTVTTFPL